MQEAKQNESLLTFPCEFPIKVVGIHSDDFEASIVVIARKHIAKLGEGAIRSKGSKNGKYLSITITFQAESRQQLDDLYRELTACEHVKMVL